VVAHTKELEQLPQNVWLAKLGATRVVFRSNVEALEAAKASQGLVVLAVPQPGPAVNVWLRATCRESGSSWTQLARRFGPPSAGDEI
jgi:hypothetical protein